METGEPDIFKDAKQDALKYVRKNSDKINEEMAKNSLGMSSLEYFITPCIGAIQWQISKKTIMGRIFPFWVNLIFKQKKLYVIIFAHNCLSLLNCGI